MTGRPCCKSPCLDIIILLLSYHFVIYCWIWKIYRRYIFNLKGSSTGFRRVILGTSKRWTAYRTFLSIRVINSIVHRTVGLVIKSCSFESLSFFSFHVTSSILTRSRLCPAAGHFWRCMHWPKTQNSRPIDDRRPIHSTAWPLLGLLVHNAVVDGLSVYCGCCHCENTWNALYSCSHA